MNTITKVNVMKFVKDLAKIEKSLTVDNTIGGMINQHASFDTVQKAMYNFGQLVTKYPNVTIDKAVENAYTANDVVSNEEAIGDLESICITDINNGYFDSNVEDGKQLAKVANQNGRYYVATPSQVKKLTAHTVANSIFDLVADDTLNKFVGQHSKQALKLLQSL